MLEIGIIGAGAMGSGIAQVAAQNKHKVTLIDTTEEALNTSKSKLAKVLARLVEKGRISSEDSIGTANNISYSTDLADLKNCGLIIEAIVENLDVKKSVFTKLESIVSSSCIIASNTSSLSIASIAASVKDSSRV
ncbi:MAG: 3-hydroxyacyl-CoA dehydrogenase family protein, partial [Flavobacteriales bacterium]